MKMLKSLSVFAVFAILFVAVVSALPTKSAFAQLSGTDQRRLIVVDGVTWARATFYSVKVVANKKAASVSTTQLLALTAGKTLDLGNGVVLTREAAKDSAGRDAFSAKINGKATKVYLAIADVKTYGKVFRVVLGK
jgi:hypothetical protein